MKQKLIALSIAGALALGTGAALQAHPEGHGAGHGVHKKMIMHGGFGLKHVTKELDLTPQQEAQVKPIIDNVKPQLRAIHEEAMQKSQALIEGAVAQIRPVLTAEQQQKLDKLRAAHEKMREAMREMHDAKAD